MVIGAAARVGAQTLVGRGCTIGHHVTIGSGVSINPGANIGGRTVIGERVRVGIGATLLDGLRIGAGAQVAAGSVVVRDVAEDVRVQGVPARVYHRNGATGMMRRRSAQERPEFEQRIKRLERGWNGSRAGSAIPGSDSRQGSPNSGARSSETSARYCWPWPGTTPATGAVSTRSGGPPSTSSPTASLSRSSRWSSARSATGWRQLIGRAVPSALAQTYTNLEVVIVGDAAGAEVRSAVEQLDDPRIRFADLTQRFVHPDPARRWLTASTLPRNEGHAMARGRWIADLDDDDALRPGAIAALVTFARQQRLEVAYGVMEQVPRSGERSRLGHFPPGPQEPAGGQQPLSYQRWDGASGCAAVFHAGLRLFAREWVAAEVPAPGDYFRLERMVRAGVRFGMLDEVVYDYYPSLLWERSAVAALTHQP